MRWRRRRSTLHMRLSIADSHVSALPLAGRIADVTSNGRPNTRAGSRNCGAAHLLGAAVAGRAALGAGRLDSAMSLFDDAVTGLTVQPPLRLGVPVSGSTGHRAGTARRQHGSLWPHWIALDPARAFRSLDYERATFGVAAAGQGVLDIAEVLSAAPECLPPRQLAAEVLCLQTATQFGDDVRSAAD